MGYPNLEQIRNEVLRALGPQQARMGDATAAQQFWDYRGKGLLAIFLRDAETPYDYVRREYRMSGLTRQMIEVLCEHLYSPGPARCWDVAAGDTFLQQVYEDNYMDAFMRRADEVSSLTDVAAIQVDADEGNFQDKPITLRLWGASDFAAWTDPDNRTVAKVVCTVDRFTDRTNYRLWTEESVTLFEAETGSTRMSADVKFVSTEKHTYGALPFAFCHYTQPITTFWESGIGFLLSQAEIRVNDRLSRIDESINKHLNPLPVAYNVDPEWPGPIIQPQRFIRVNNAKIRPSPSGGYEPGEAPDLRYLVAPIDVAGAWDDLTKFLNQMLQALRVPGAAVRMEEQTMASGIALIVEQAPLLTRARKRRYPWGIYETDVARCILRCAGGYYGRPALVQAAKVGRLNLTWPQPTMPIPTKENLDLLLEQVSARFMSFPQAVAYWFGLSREAAFEQLEQIEEDNEEMRQRVPSIAQFIEGGAGPEGEAEAEVERAEGEASSNGKPGRSLEGEPEEGVEFESEEQGIPKEVSAA